jgi:hypothetical protein
MVDWPLSQVLTRHQPNSLQSLMQRPLGWPHAPAIFFDIFFAAIAGHNETAGDTAATSITLSISFVMAVVPPGV